MKGCPFNGFGPCKEAECMFYLSNDHAFAVLSLLDSDLTLSPAKPDNRCVIWLNFLASQEIFAASDAASRFVAYRPELAPFADHPQKLLFELLCRLESKLESLEKELKKS